MAKRSSLRELIASAVNAGGHKDRREAMEAALEEYIKIKQRLRFLELEGTIDFDPAWNYKAAPRAANKRIPKD